MPLTDIKVYGSARDIRTPDRAEVRLKVSKWGRELPSIHQAVTLAVGALTDSLRQLAASYPQALGEPSIAQFSQKTWTDDIGTAYSESVDVTVLFSDFQAMSQWIFSHTLDLVQLQSIDWALSAAALSEVSISLRVEAMRDARRKAETFAVAAGLVIVGIQTLADPELAGAEPAPPQAPERQAPAVAPIGPNGGGIDITPVPVESTVRLAAHFLAEPDQSTASSPSHRSLHSFLRS